MSQYQQWCAAPHHFGPGRVHAIDSEDGTKTLCGRALAAIGGKGVSNPEPSCKACINAIAARKRNAEWQERQKRNNEEADDARAERKRWYREVYLKSPEWREKRRLVMRRSGGICEGCLSARAAHVHHVTYDHIGDELLWELRAVCEGCHERAHVGREQLWARIRAGLL